MLNRCHLLSLFLLFALSRSESGLRQRRRPSESDEDRHWVTIDLSALRPSMPGLVLYKYGDHAPKLVQVDRSTINPLLQPHVIWPQFNELDMDERLGYDLDNGEEAIPYLTEEEESLISSPRRLSKMSSSSSSSNWLDRAGSDNDIYDFVQDQGTITLQGSLPLADEVIVPLDWEEKTKRGEEVKKSDVFITRGWKAGGGNIPHKSPAARKGSDTRARNPYYSRNLGSLFHGIPAKMVPMREIETDEGGPTRTRGPANGGQLGKKDLQQPGPLPQPAGHHMARGPGPTEEARIPSQESWAVPRQYWNVPHLFVNNWQ